MSLPTFGTSPFSRRALIRRATATGVGLMGLDLLAACGTSSSTATASHIAFSTNELPPSSNPAQVRIFHDYVNTFQQNHPGVTLNAFADGYDPKTYFAKAAAKTQEDVVDTYFTEPQLMIQRHTVADITDQAGKQSFFSNYAPSALAIVSSGSKVYGLPYSGYTLGLMYSIKLVKAAGLDPNTPPKTWDDFRMYAKKISDATKVPGFVELTKDNTGGWHLTNWIYTGGGNLEDTSSSSTKATFNNDVAVNWLKLLQTMKHVDQSLYPDVLVGYGDALQIFASGKAGMVVEAADTLAALVTGYQADIKDIGLWPMPQNGGNATLSGGHAYVFKAGDNADVLNAAVEWASYYRFDLGVYEDSTAQASAAGLPIGSPGGILFTGSYQQQRMDIEKKYANLPLDNYAPFVAATLGVRPEPPVQTQALYAALDPVVQQVLTDGNANPQSLLDTAAQQFQTKLDAGS